MKSSILTICIASSLLFPSVCLGGGKTPADGLAQAIQHTRKARVSLGFSGKSVIKLLDRSLSLLADSEAVTPSTEIASAIATLVVLEAGVLDGPDAPVAEHLMSLDGVVDLIEASGLLPPVVPTTPTAKDLKKLQKRSRSALKAWEKAYQKLSKSSSGASKQMRKSAKKIVALIDRHSGVLTASEVTLLEGVIDDYVLLAHYVKFTAEPDWVQAKTDLFDIGVDFREAPFYLAATGQRLSWLQLLSGNFEGIIHGSGPTMGFKEHDDYQAAFAATPSLLARIDENILLTNRFTNAQKAKRMKKFMTKRYPGEIPLLGLSYSDKGAPKGPVGRECQIAAGEWDEDIRTFGRTLRQFGRPVFVRPAFEFNGDWNNYGTVCFIPAFRRIVDIFREEGALAIFIWNAKATPEFNDMQQILADWYPGDDYVDYWGIDIFSSDLQSPVVNANMVQFIDESVAVGKPLIVPECAPSFLDINDPTTWTDWFVPFFDDVVLAYPSLKGFCYANQDFSMINGLTGWGDLRIDQSALKDDYAERLANPIFLHQLP